jgi:hypothetical protein
MKDLNIEHRTENIERRIPGVITAGTTFDVRCSTFSVRCLPPLRSSSILAFLVLLLLVSTASAASRFGDIVVAPQALVSGETHHGYRELRVLLENQSLKNAHRVTLVFPDRSYAYGNCLSRVSRTVTLNPASRAMIPLWLPPLPASGNGLLRLEIDDFEPETVNLSAAHSHLPRYGYGPHYGGGPQPPSTVLVSRTLNYDELNRVFKRQTDDFSAAAATGPADASGRRSAASQVWMPDYSGSGPHWLELEYDPPIIADRVCIHETSGSPPGGEIIMTGVSGTNLVRIPIGRTPVTRPITGPGSRTAGREYAFALTPEPVKTVRLDFGTTYSASISIDAVALENSGASNTVWASSARASSEGGPTTGRGSGEAHVLLRAEAPVPEWTEYWLSYTPFDAIALAAGDLKAMPPPILDAIWRYTESGGTLIILGSADVPSTWRPAGGRKLNAGFGRCYVFEGDRIPGTAGASALKEMLDTISASARYWQSLPNDDSANNIFPVIENVQIPVRGTVFIMLAFVVLIGPVNLYVLSRMNRRTWLLWTIPAISLVTCLLVFAYSLLREGVTPDVRTEGLTLLDQLNRRATSVGMTAFYCPLTPSKGVSFRFDTEATPLVNVEPWGRRSGTQREVDWTQSQQLGRGWVMARVPAHFQLRKSETRRERLQLDASNGQLTVINGLGAGIRSLWLADSSGRIYRATNVAVGQKAALSPNSANPSVTDQLGPRLLFERTGFQAWNSDTSAITAYLLPNTYIAELDANPFLENGLGARGKSVRSRERSVVFGILE